MTGYLLTFITLLPLVGVVALAFAGRGERPNEKAQKWTALIFALATFVISLALPLGFDPLGGRQFETNVPWINAFNLGVRYHVAVDGLSLWLVVLTTLLVPLALVSSWNSIHYRVREFLIAMLALETGMIGVFVAMDMFLFYLFWEVMLVPMYFLIGVWGGERRVYAAVKFVIYTVVASLLMLAGIIALYYLHGQATGNFTFDIPTITDHVQNHALNLSPATQGWLFWAFGLAFLVKVPLFPFHTWLPDAHVEAPTAGSVILAGVLLKMGTYGLMRFNLPIFPDASREWAAVIATLAVIGIIYGALVAMVQPDMKKLVAYSSVSHLGFVVLGIFSFTDKGMQGALYQMLNHGVSTGALFIIVGMIYDRRHTRLIAEFGGLANVMPVYSTLFLIVTLSSIALPLLNGFVGEFLILIGAFTSPVLPHAKLFGSLAAIGMILSAVYMLWMYQRVVYGEVRNPANVKLADLSGREKLALAPLIALIFVMGVYPNLFLSRSDAAIQSIRARFSPAAETVEAATGTVVEIEEQ
ncbi:MAG TPA: NADH-quinone oxidoreductase subunit M [Blastocatellia bacterium]|jgi:NADH-quinone oxidoreductase subunit M|nr:NADH-quinone oxidoreductase subunit M [Blastocatellia bacterium]